MGLQRLAGSGGDAPQGGELMGGAAITFRGAHSCNCLLLVVVGGGIMGGSLPRLPSLLHHPSAATHTGSLALGHLFLLLHQQLMAGLPA